MIELPGRRREQERGRQQRGWRKMGGGALLLALLDRVAVLAGHDLDLGRRDDLVRLHLELRVLHDERPHVVAETVCVEVALSSTNVHGRGRDAARETRGRAVP